MKKLLASQKRNRFLVGAGRAGEGRVATLIEYPIYSNKTPSLRSVVTSITAVFHYICITTERTTFQHDTMLVQPSNFIKSWFGYKYILYSFKSFEQKLLKLRR